MTCNDNAWEKREHCTPQNCNNGIWENGEECDPLVPYSDNCCKNVCLRDTSSKCNALDPSIDASFIDGSGKMWLFKGDKYVIYSNMHGDVNAPETFEDIAELNMYWTQGLSAALYVSGEDIVYFFKDFSYYRYNLGERRQIDEYPIIIEKNLQGLPGYVYPSNVSVLRNSFRRFYEIVSPSSIAVESTPLSLLGIKDI